MIAMNIRLPLRIAHRNGNPASGKFRGYSATCSVAKNIKEKAPVLPGLSYYYAFDDVVRPGTVSDAGADGGCDERG
jgi:hypothetical protein